MANQEMVFLGGLLARLAVGENDTQEVRFDGHPGRVGGRHWTDADHLVADVYHETEAVLPVRVRFGTGPGWRDPVMTASYGVLPEVRTRLSFPLSALNAETVFLPRTPGRLKAVLQGKPSRPDDICWFTIGTGDLGLDASLEITGIRITERPELLVPAGPALVDPFGQWVGRDWVGKIPDGELLRDRLRSAAAAALPERPPDRTEFGGSAVLMFDGTGYFRTHHDGRRWWLVDPAGGAFWSAGVDCVRPDAGTPVEGNERLCQWLPARDDAEFAGAWNGGFFSWHIANLIRAFGDEWEQGWHDLTARGLSRFGFNTIGNWSDTAFARQAKIPYVLPLADFPQTAGTVFRDFPDVFAPEYAADAARFAAQLEPCRDDPYLVGYFLRNEPLWAFGAFPLTEELLANEPQRAPYCRRALTEFLRPIYETDPDLFESHWGGVLARLEDLNHAVIIAHDMLVAPARDLLAEFSRRMIDAYVRIPSDACRAVDPNHLNLGMRWAWIASDDLLAGSDACDVFSMNCYDFRIDPKTVQQAARVSGRPVLIGEFHFGAIDRGLLCGGLRGVATQHDRGLAYRYYVEQAASLPDVVGAHYFQWNDQPFLGRFDGENWQIGLIDVCHTAYPEILAAARQTHQTIYDVASGSRPPYGERPLAGPKLGI